MSLHLAVTIALPSTQAPFAEHSNWEVLPLVKMAYKAVKLDSQSCEALPACFYSIDRITLSVACAFEPMTKGRMQMFHQDLSSHSHCRKELQYTGKKLDWKSNPQMAFYEMSLLWYF